MTPEQELRNAGKAQEILGNDLWGQAFRDLERVLVDGIVRTAFVDDKLREKLCQRLASLHEVRRQLESHIETGKLTQTLIERAKQKIGI